MVLVTGATGFIGATLVRQLLEAEQDVRILKRTGSQLDLLGVLSDDVDHAIGDVTEPDSLEAAMNGIQQVYHAAAFVGFSGRKDRRKLYEVNVLGTANVVNTAVESGVDRLVHVSSIAALGRTANGGGQLIDETHEWSNSKANSAYAESKHLAEMEVHRAIAEGLDAIIVNPALVFGEGREGENTMHIAEKLLDGSIPATPSGGTCVVDVEDVVAGMRLAMAGGRMGERYILGAENLTWAEILATLAESLGTERPSRILGRTPAMLIAAVSETVSSITGSRQLISWETARSSTSTHYYSNKKAIEELGCTFRPFEDTADRVAQKLLA